MLKTMKYRLKPTKTQAKQLDGQLVECRWLYNHSLVSRRDVWQERQESLSYHKQATTLPQLKEERSTLAGIHSQALSIAEQTSCPEFLRTAEKDLKRTQRKRSAAEKGTPERAKRRKIVLRLGQQSLEVVPGSSGL